MSHGCFKNRTMTLGSLILFIVLSPQYSISDEVLDAKVALISNIKICYEEYSTTAGTENCLNRVAFDAGIERESELKVKNHWVIYPIKIDPIDESKSVQIKVQSLDSHRTLVISCDNNTTFLFLDKNPLLDSVSEEKLTTVASRFDSRSPDHACLLYTSDAADE